MNRTETPLLRVKHLSTRFQTLRGPVTAIDGVSFKIYPDEIVGIVGESGCGKSVTSQSILRLYDEKKGGVQYSGEIFFDGEDLLKKTANEMQDIRGNEIAMIFQDALSSLNPVFTVGYQITEALRIHNKGMTKRQAEKRAEELLRLTNIPSPKERLKSYPHELSGGMRQRAMIAMGLACEPKLLIADEPTTALDVTIQAQIMDLIVDLNKRLSMGIMLITHDLGVVAQVCQRIIIMYLGQVVEQGSIDDIFNHPRHPYTMGLIKSIPTLKSDKTQKLYMIEGTVPSLNQVGAGCRFRERCPNATEQCAKEMPPVRELSDSQRARCWYAGEIEFKG